MSGSKAAPAAFKQPSRKGKKAWRKNVDVTDEQAGLDDLREQIIHGGIVSEKSADQLFTIDTAGSKDIAKDYRLRHKPLKADEILAQRSAVPAVNSKKRFSDFEAPKPKKARVSNKTYDKLRAIAYGGDQVQKNIVDVGDSADHDPWAVEPKQKDPKFSFLEEEKPAAEPVTLKHAPVALSKNGKAIPAVRKPDAGKSYNPTLLDWANLLEREGEKEVEAEKQRLQEAQEEAERMERALAAAAEEEAAKSDDAETDWESEWDGFQTENEDEKLETKKPGRKTPAERNKIKKRKEAEQKAKHDAKMKERERQLQKIKQIKKDVEAKEKAREAATALVVEVKEEESSESESEEVLRKKRFGKARIPNAPLEVVLPDELQDCLRRLKPEGNLLKDRFRSMMVRGKVEVRRPIQAKKRQMKPTEKWSYKDWRLEDHAPSR